MVLCGVAAIMVLRFIIVYSHLFNPRLNFARIKAIFFFGTFNSVKHGKEIFYAAKKKEKHEKHIWRQVWVVI